MFKMIWEAEMPADRRGARMPSRSGREHAAQALELATLTRPGPFGLRTIELGEYFGYFDGQRLVAMAGERMHAGTLREISGVCTYPDFQGRGLARKLMLKLVRRQMQRNETPFLHVMRRTAAPVGCMSAWAFATTGKQSYASSRATDPAAEEATRLRDQPRRNREPTPPPSSFAIRRCHTTMANDGYTQGPCDSRASWKSGTTTAASVSSRRCGVATPSSSISPPFRRMGDAPGSVRF